MRPDPGDGVAAPRERWTVAVLGPGGVGGLVAALLVRAGHRVIVVAREETADAIGERGLWVSSALHGEFEVAVEAVTELREPVDALVVATKETGLVAALERVAPAALEKTPLLPLLNGVEHPRVLRERCPSAYVVPGTIRVESTRTETGRIEHTSPFARIELAGRDTPPERVAALASLLEGAGFETVVRTDETRMLWSKLSFLLPMALLTTRYGLPVGGVRTERREEMLAVIGELVAVATAAGAPLDRDGILAVIDAAPYGMRSSMQRDAEAGRPLELDAIGGAALREAARHGIAAPVTARLVEEVERAAD
ncbi:2-dehydropantoate 2-reductase [Streptomyces tsukubensis]|uniref:2-dehydropantoate 2-reductase n=1 Tax=Streptomyces tsukubensis TaxID=83656 RepID=A0A1V3ZZ74_9ACTN|nr:2-dehydropantoate 2-reductase [Streptomyces tsukubensis]